MPYAIKLQWRNRLAHGTYKTVSVFITQSNAVVVSSNLTWSILFDPNTTKINF